MHIKSFIKNAVPHFFHHLRAERSQTSRQLALFERLIPKGALVFDVGANVGNRISAFLAIGAKVVAVEPQPECVQRLKGKFGDRIAIIQAAAGATRSKLPLHVSASMDTVASLSPKFLSHVKDSGRFGDRSWDRTIQVDVLTLDSIISEYGAPVFIKIDVEGFEYSVLGGLSRAVDVVSIEWTADMPEEAIRCIDRFVELGMPWFQFSFGEGMRLAHGKSLDAQQAKALVGMLGEDQFLFGDIYASRRPIFR